MKFTEREMTVAVDAVARGTFDALPKLLRRRAGATSWEELGKGARYPHLVAAGGLVLPGLTALPERPTVGEPPPFTDEEYAAAAEEVLRSRASAEDADGWERLPERRRRKAVEAAGQVLRAAVQAMPVRRDPDALVVPDDLGGL